MRTTTTTDTCHPSGTCDHGTCCAWHCQPCQGYDLGTIRYYGCPMVGYGVKCACCRTVGYGLYMNQIGEGVRCKSSHAELRLAQ